MIIKTGDASILEIIKDAEVDDEQIASAVEVAKESVKNSNKVGNKIELPNDSSEKSKLGLN